MNKPESSSPTSTQKESAPIDQEWLTVSGFNRLWRADEQFREFARQVYNYLENMRPGRVVTFRRYSGQKLEWCIRTASTFLLESIHRWDWWIGDDFMSVHRSAVHFDPTETPHPSRKAPKTCTVTIHQHDGHVGLNTRIT